jgi:hypothetical protein
MGGAASAPAWGGQSAGVGWRKRRCGAANTPGWNNEGAGVERHAYLESGIEGDAERESGAASSAVIPPASARIFISKFSDVKLKCCKKNEMTDNDLV